MQPQTHTTQTPNADRAAATRWARSLARTRNVRVATRNSAKPVTFDQFAFDTLFQRKATAR